MHPFSKIRKQSGFTLVEVAIVMPMAMLLIAGMVTILFAMLNDFNTGKVRQTLQYQNQAALETIEQDVKLSNAFLTKQDPLPMNPDYYGYALGSQYVAPIPQPDTCVPGHWVWFTWVPTVCTPNPPIPSPTPSGVTYKGDQFTSTNARSLVLRNYATTLDTNNPNRRAIIKTQDAQGNDISCTAAPFLTNNATYNIIYFVRSGTLYRRIVTSSAPNCNGNTQYQKQSCPEAVSNRINSGCADGVNDAKLLDNVTAFSVDYYVNPTDSTPKSVYTVSNDDVLSDVSTAVVNVTTQGKDSKGNPLSVTSSIRTSEAN